MTVQHHRVEGVAVVGVEERLLRGEPLLELDVEHSLQEHLVTDLVIQISERVLEESKINQLEKLEAAKAA